MTEKSIAIIGAGVAGLSAGCYGRMNGYRTQVFEMHDKPGGLCTAWQRKGYTIDGCIHWLVGSKPGQGMYRIWQELGMVQGRTFVDADEFLRYESRDGTAFILHADVDRLQEHMLEIAPEDREAIRDFCNGIRAFVKIGDMPITKPSELMSAWEKVWLGLGMTWKYGRVMRWLRQPTTAVMARFKSPLIRDGILSAWPGTFPAGFLLMTLAWLHNKAAGYPIGGSLGLAQAIEERYRRLGGEIRYKARVAKILTEADRAVGVALDDGTEHQADYVISAADGHATIFDMLGAKYADDTVRGYYETLQPFPALVFVGLGINRSFEDVPKTVSGLQWELSEPVRIADRDLTSIGFHFFNQDPTLAPHGKTAVVCMIPSSLEWWENLRRDAGRYAAAKADVAQKVIGLLDRRFPGVARQVEVEDVATPSTFVRYTGNWQGSFEGWMVTPETITLRMKKTLPGLSNFWMCGQWVEPGGGLPPAATSGRQVIQLVCHQDGRRFTTSVPEANAQGGTRGAERAK